MEKLIRFLKNWTLPIAMAVGIISYIILANVSCLSPVKHPVHTFVTYLCPVLIFLQLFVTFCKIDPKDMIPSKWNIWLGVFQVVSACAVALIVILFDIENRALKFCLEGIIVMLICPTATAAAVITNKLGGNAASLSTYTLISNIIAAIVVPVLFPLIEPSDMKYTTAFLIILKRSFILLVMPFITAYAVRKLLPKVQEAIGRKSDIAFYLWAICLTCVIGMAAHISVTINVPAYQQVLTALAVLVVCALLFVIGKKYGSRYGERISCGQALGQKNTTLAIWMTYTYMSPFAALGPGSYIVWQNIINSYQLYLKRKDKLKK